MKPLRPFYDVPRLRHTFLLAALALSSAVTGTAQVVSFNFTGTIQQVDDPAALLPGDITVGLPYSGTVTYNTLQVQDVLPLDPSNGLYLFQGPSAGEFSMNVTLGSHVISVNPGPSLPNYIQAFLGDVDDLLDYGAREALLDGANPPGDLFEWSANVSLRDSTATVLASDALPTSSPVLGDFNNPVFYFETLGPNNYSFSGAIISISPVPEPAATCAVIATGLAALAV